MFNQELGMGSPEPFSLEIIPESPVLPGEKIVTDDDGENPPGKGLDPNDPEDFA
ncbi:hypothetical protein J2129_000271 [Methanofollis sp. W23]|uniref:hypothetical protein n=1 Tax=Methanofollis sp. W23 TaxID=2817849 RepID=UPI001AE53F73|nr:hypothetical protein [Methanofollis sp. W23]MBP2144817.1 hypothetical protein [Methanofollis sp. W23]